MKTTKIITLLLTITLTLPQITITKRESLTCNKQIKGPDTIPKFDPTSDCEGCFETKSRMNNCYNYALDIVTNTYAITGRGSNTRFRHVNCEEINEKP